MATPAETSDDTLRGGYVRCTECNQPLRATRAAGLRHLWPMHLFCAIERQDDEGAGAHAIAGFITHMRWSFGA